MSIFTQVALQAVPSQTLNIVLAGQYCQLTIYTNDYGLFLDLSVNNVPIANGNLCQDRNLIITKPYLGFSGQFYFADTQGSSDPVYTGLGTRFLLFYIPIPPATAT
jgi:hypothetical protein